VLSPIKRILLGRPLPSTAERQERFTRVTGLAVLSSDALSSVAYAPDAMLEVLGAFGLVAISYGPRLALLIVTLLFIVTFSYRQTIFAYPQGGGAYIVAKSNLGVIAGLVAAVALLIDYVLTVAVSVSAGVSAIVSAAPSLDSTRVVMAVGFVALITWGNLRGVREAGRIFAGPTYAFIASIAVLLGVGIWQLVTQQLPSAAAPAVSISTSTVGLFVLLRAFANGCTAMTGVEAISNGIPAFQQPEAKNAGATLLTMTAILAVMFLGISLLSAKLHIVPQGQETVLSQLGRTVFGGRNLPYLVVQITTTFILVLAANTSYADFPRLASILAHDRFAPVQFTHRGDRLAFSNGIVLLASLATALVVIAGAHELRLIPLYAVGVFLSYTLSQAGMVNHWRRTREPGWLWRAAINALGATATGTVLTIFVATKFREGAWIVLFLIPMGVWLLVTISRHYQLAHAALELPAHPLAGPRQHVIVMVIPDLNLEVATMIAYARQLKGDLRAVHVNLDQRSADAIQDEWLRWGQDAKLTVLESPHQSFVEPVLKYIRDMDGEPLHRFFTILIPEVRPRDWWQTMLHNRWSKQLRSELKDLEHVAVIASFNWPLRTEI